MNGHSLRGKMQCRYLLVSVNLHKMALVKPNITGKGYDNIFWSWDLSGFGRDTQMTSCFSSAIVN